MYPLAIENVASEHPRVLDTIAFGETSEMGGEAVHLARQAFT